MTTRKLVSNVHIEDADGLAHVFGPDDDVPGWAVKLITNKAAWEADDSEAVEVDSLPQAPKRPGRVPRPITEQ